MIIQTKYPPLKIWPIETETIFLHKFCDYHLMKTKDELIDDLLSLAFAEDIGDGDHTTLSTIGPDAMGKQHLLIKEEGIIAGVDIARKVFAKFDPTLKMTVFIEDGTHVRPGDIAFVVEGTVRSLLQTERLMLNIMQRMSGIATITARYQERLAGLNCKVLDTRRPLRACASLKRKPLPQAEDTTTA